MNNNNLVYNLRISVISPVHIGAGMEKCWTKNIDYFYDTKNREVNVIDLNDLLSGKSSDYASKIANAIAKQNLFSSNLFKLDSINAKHKYTIFPEPADIIRTHIRSGIGNLIIPGSSLKGAIRSALLGWLYSNDPEIKLISKNVEVELFGSVDDSVMRFIQISDSEFPDNCSKLYHSKIYSLSSNLKGTWKNARKGSESKFSPVGFVQTYECINEESVSASRIVIAKKTLELLTKKPKYTNKIVDLSENPLIKIFKTINSFTKTYLGKEIDYFKHHEGELSNNLIDELEYIQEKVTECKPNECILHLGSASGFHGITGDWQFTTHIINGIEPKINRGLIFSKPAAKTRRFFFEMDDEEPIFRAPGYIKLEVQ